MSTKRVDANQTAIVEALRGVGASVLSLAALGNGVPDLLVAFRGQCYLLECKSKDGKLTPDQWAWIFMWKGDVAVVRSADEALKAIGVEVESG